SPRDRRSRNGACPRGTSRRKYLLVSLVWFLGVTSVLLLELKTETNLIPDRSFVTRGVVWGVVIGVGVGSLSYGLGAGVRKVLRSQSRRGDV
ncbi:MAG: hypothetical protein SV253_09840, partial [Halobacteria archaeon]|nr:hypothetical protein [Halobacteria archaeon]